MKYTNDEKSRIEVLIDEAKDAAPPATTALQWHVSDADDDGSSGKTVHELANKSTDIV